MNHTLPTACATHEIPAAPPHRLLDVQRFPHPIDKLGLFGSGGNPHALKIAAEPDVRVAGTGVLVEMEERTRTARKVAALALPQLRELTKLDQQGIDLIKVFLRCMPHLPSMTLAI